MIIIQDTREQVPLVFDHPWITDIEVSKLNVGDYGCRFKDGHVPSVYFERKAMGDLFSTLGKGYKRFKREIVRAQQSKSQLVIIIEGCLSKVLRGTQYSSVNPEALVKRLFTLWVKHGVYPVWCKDSGELAEYITQFYIAAGKEYMRRQANGRPKRTSKTSGKISKGT